MRLGINITEIGSGPFDNWWWSWILMVCLYCICVTPESTAKKHTPPTFSACTKPRNEAREPSWGHPLLLLRRCLVTMCLMTAVQSNFISGFGPCGAEGSEWGLSSKLLHPWEHHRSSNHAKSQSNNVRVMARIVECWILASMHRQSYLMMLSCDHLI